MVVCHLATPREEIINQIGNAEILVTCCGDPEFIQAEWVSEGTIIIDVGITYKHDEESNDHMILGDCQFNEEMLRKVKRITPVPGGVGPMTVTMLMNNLT